MGFNCGIIGLPNVGKSTIFNALTAAEVEAANYPFCTIEPNHGIVALPDSRLEVLGKLAGSAKIVPTTIDFVDIAGLVKGASQGEGLGNQFLGHIREVDAIAHVIRCFEDENVAHVHGKISPLDDILVVETELLLADLNSVERRLEKVSKSFKTGDKSVREELDLLKLAQSCLAAGTALRMADSASELRKLNLLSSKPTLYVANIAEKDLSFADTPLPGTALEELTQLALREEVELVIICGAVEAELQLLQKEEQKLYLKELGLSRSGLERLALAGYKSLNLITFFTANTKEAHAWTCTQDTLAPQAAGKVHSDFESGFIRAEVVSYDEFVHCAGEQKAREQGLLRIEGKTYRVQDGDIIHFRFNV